MTEPRRDIQVATNKTTLAELIADEFVDAVTAALHERGVAHVVLTGGSMGNAFIEALEARADEIPAQSLHLWWGDERFVPAADSERNALQAFNAGLGTLGVPTSNIHEMPASDGSFGDDVDAAADGYADELTEVGGGQAPVFDVVMLGMGPDTHVASLFPGYPQTRIDDAVTAAVTNSPKPPPTRITMTFDTLNNSRAVWLMVAGLDKAPGVAAALMSEDRTVNPAHGVHGQNSTVWFLDEEAASQVELSAAHD